MLQDYANKWVFASLRSLAAEMGKKGFIITFKTVGAHLKILKSTTKTAHIKPALNDAQKKLRLGFVLGKIDTRHGKPDLMN